MKNFSLTTLIIILLETMVFSQNLSQTIRGTILDADSKLPLIGATVAIVGSNPLIGTATDANGNLVVDPANNRFWDYSNAYNNSLDNLFKLDLSVSYKINGSKATHEIFLDLPNITNHRGKMSEFYDASKPNKIGYITQMAFLPNIMYRVYF